MKNLYHPSKRVNSGYYKAVLDRLQNRMAQISLELYESGDWFLLHDNAPSHNDALIHEFLTKKKGDHPSSTPPPYSPDLALADNFLFPQTKK